MIMTQDYEHMLLIKYIMDDIIEQILCTGFLMIQTIHQDQDEDEEEDEDQDEDES